MQNCAPSSSTAMFTENPNINNIAKPVSGSVINNIGNYLQTKIRNKEPTMLKQIFTALPALETIPICSPSETVSNGTYSPAGSSTSSNDDQRKRSSSTSELENQAKRLKVDGNHSENDESGTPSNCENVIPSMVVPFIPKKYSKPTDIFMQVPGRLSLLTSTNRYQVTVGEIQRRLSHPENLNASVLGAILRRAKSKNGGKELRSILEQNGMVLPAGRRKTTQITLFTSMIEGEAEHLAKDFDFLCNHEFPATEFAQLAVLKDKNEKENMKKRKKDLSCALNVINELMSGLTETTNKENLPMQQPMEQFQLLTHNFGKPAILTICGVINKYITAQLSLLTSALEVKPEVQQQSMIPNPKPNVAPFSNDLLFGGAELTLQALLHYCQQRNVM